MIPIRDRKSDIASEVAQGKNLHKRIIALAEEASRSSIDEGLELNELLAKISRRENLNRLQIQRLVEETNTVAYNMRYDKLRDSHDRRITFPIASLEGVITEMGFNAPPEISNPNLSSGGKGEGEIDKAASTTVEPSPIHTPHSGLEERRERYLQKMASVNKKQSEKNQARVEREINSSIFKIANTLVMTERHLKTANEVFNTLLSDVDLSDDSIEGIVKKASVISEHMVKTKRSRPGFMVTLKQNPTEKVADHILGDYSLIKEAEDIPKVKEVKIQPTLDVADFNQLVSLAQKLEQQQNALKQQPAFAGSEVKPNVR